MNNNNEFDKYVQLYNTLYKMMYENSIKENCSCNYDALWNLFFTINDMGDITPKLKNVSSDKIS